MRTRANHHNTTITLKDPIYFTIGAESYWYDGDVDVAFTWEDFGIGRYEYGSQVGYDVAYGVEEVEIVGFDLGYVHRELGDGSDYEPITKEEAKTMKDAILAAMNKQAMSSGDPLHEYLRDVCEPEDYRD